MNCLHRLLLAVSLCIIALSGCQQPREVSPNPLSKIQDSTAQLFEDRTIAAGLNFQHTVGATGKFLFAENTPPGAAFLDFDSDGWLDIFLVQSGAVVPTPNYSRPQCQLWRNKRDGTFENVTIGSGLDKDLGFAQGVAAADYDNDGFTDIFLTAYGGNHLLRNERGSGKFRDVTKQMGLDNEKGYSTSAAWGDFDSDGRLDLYLCRYVKWTPQTDKQCRNDATGELDYCSPLLYDPVPHRLYKNIGQKFLDVSQQSGIASKTGRGLAVVTLDFNSDGKLDIYVANDLTPNLLWKNKGDGTFSDVAIEAGVAYGDQGRVMAGMGIAIADYDHSGRESLYVSNFSERPNMLFRNSGSGLFEDATAQIVPTNSHNRILTFGCEFFDYDADGWQDVITNNGHVEMFPAQRTPGVEYKQPKQLLHNEGGKTLRLVSDPQLLGELSTPTLGRGLAIGDYNNDGHLDFLAANQEERPQLFHNKTKNKNNWISLRLVGTKSNRDAIGARVALRAGKLKQSASVHGGSSYLSTSDRRLYFGLNTAARVDELQIRWPSGLRQTIKDLDANRFYIWREGDTPKAIQ